MPLLHATSHAALEILRQPVHAAPAQKDRYPDAAELVAIAHGKKLDEGTGLDPQPTASQSRVAKAMFSGETANLTRMKMDFIIKIGKELGFQEKDFRSHDDFVAAVSDTFRDLNKTAEGRLKLSEIERKLGLDALGLSIQDLIAAARDPEKNDKVTEALAKKYGLSDLAESDRPVRADEIGLYYPVR